MSFSYRPEIAKAIAVTLTEKGHESAIYNITTPDTVSMRELAEFAAEISGHDYRYEPISDQDWRDRWEKKNKTEWEVEAGLTSYEALRNGELDITSDDYTMLTGQEPVSIRELVTRLADHLPFSAATTTP